MAKRHSIRGKIAAFVPSVFSDDDCIIINRGAAHGVENGQEYRVIISGESMNIRDPETLEIIGVTRPDAGLLLRVTETQEKLAILTVARDRRGMCYKIKIGDEVEQIWGR